MAGGYGRTEIWALAHRASIGAGLPPKMATEAARATLWLRARGIEACDPLLSLLFQHDEQSAHCADPAQPGDSGDTAWHCPLRCGAVLRDRGPAALPPQLNRLALPVLLLPALAETALGPVAITWAGGRAWTDGDGIACDAPPGMADVTIAPTGAIAARPDRPAPEPEPDQMILAALAIYAARAGADRAESA